MGAIDGMGVPIVQVDPQTEIRQQWTVWMYLYSTGRPTDLTYRAGSPTDRDTGAVDGMGEPIVQV